MLFKRLFALLCFVFIFQQNVAQLSTKHYIPPLTSSENVGLQYIYISTPKNNNVSFTITPVGGGANSIISNTVSNSTPYVHTINSTANGNQSQLFVLQNQVNHKIDNKGYIIEASDVIYVSVRIRSSSTFHAGALVSKGLSALGTEFRVGGFVNGAGVMPPPQQPGAPPSFYSSFVSAMATEDNTTITVSGFKDTSAIVNLSANSNFTITLNEGESYVVATVTTIDNESSDDIIGALVKSDKPIVVNSGSMTGSFDGVSGGRDFGIDQLVGASKVGSEYIFVKGDGGFNGNSWENVLIIANENNTEVFVNGNAGSVATLNAGDYHVIEGDSYTNENMYVQTSKPVFAYQGVGGLANSKPNQGMFFVPPLSCENKGDVNNIANIGAIGPVPFPGGVTIVTEKGATVEINNTSISNFNTSGPFDVDGNPNYVTYKVKGLNNNIKVVSTGELYCAYFNANSFAASGSFYSGFPSPPEISYNTSITSLGNCIPNVNLTALNTDLFDSFEWYFDDGSGFVSTGNTSNTITPSTPGKYKLIGVISCSGNEFESQIVPVSICPDDFDNDKIIDNLDVDLDNDGLTNEQESMGDVVLDFTDINTPVLNFVNGGTDNSHISTSLTTSGTTSLTGDTSSNFTSTIDAGINSVSEYTLNFNKASNIQFTYTPDETHTIVGGEVFTLIIGPNTKNLTLIDPDNILLVDTNFDDFFETDINYYSASEIRFQFNPNPKGATPFKFIANSVSGITFKHELNNISDNSAFKANLQLTTFALDSDGDGIEDALDLDSDNDGIPDLVEVSGGITTLSGTDDDENGLDDMFNNFTPADTDGDGVLDVLDVDSDNDGIFDVVEAGHGLADADLNGVIDNLIVGANGLVDSIEVVVDIGVLNYTIADTDTDNSINSTDLDSDGDRCSDVIEAGFIDDNADDIIGPTPVQVDANGKVINIPDGYTTPHPNYLIIAPIDLNTAFEDVAFCEASTSTISIDSTADIFQWEISTDNGNSWNDLTDDAIYSGTTTSNLQITNILQSYNNHQFRVTMERNGNSCNETSNVITLSVEPLPVINATAELKQCDDDIDGFSLFNLFEAASNISSNHENETFEFYPTLADAQAGTNVIANPTAFENRVVTTDKVWARAISAFGCHQISEVTLTVSTTGIPPAFSREFSTCDDFLDVNGDSNDNNDDTDGVSSFDFSSVTAEVRALFPPNQQLIITYYRNEADALAEQNVIEDPSNYRNIGYANNQTIYIRVDSELNNDCLGFGPHITLNVDPVPEATDVDDIVVCDNLDDGDGFNGLVTFDLTTQTSTILGTQNPADYTVTYHISAEDANNGSNAIANPSMFENTIRDRQTIYARVTDNSSAGCFNDHVSFDLVVEPLPIANFVENLEICDDATDGSAQNGFSQSFDLEVQTAGILGNQDPNVFDVTYHASLEDAQNGVLPLGSPFSNTVPNEQLIWVRVVNKNTSCANEISNFKVIVNPEPTFEHASNLSYCDDAEDGDDTNGIVNKIDFNSMIPEILGATQEQDDFIVTFHESKQDATIGQFSLSSPYTNTTPFFQTIYVRIENKDTGCINDDFTFQIQINPLPDFEVTTPQIVCLNGPELTLSVENPAAVYDYVWKDPNGNILVGESITVTSGGVYEVTGTGTDEFECSRTWKIRVNESIIANLTDNDITVVDDSLNNSITIDPTNLGIGDYEYALADEKGNTIRFFQSEPYFDQLKGGFYTVLVRDRNGCGTASLLVNIVEFPKFFTPNDDGENDTWVIKGANSTFFPNSKIYIFNRYGKPVAEIPIDGRGWDGTYKGNNLPSDDYWFSIHLVDRNGVVRERKGHFSLLRK